MAGTSAGAEHVGRGRERYKLGIVIPRDWNPYGKIKEANPAGLAACKTLGIPSKQAKLWLEQSCARNS